MKIVLAIERSGTSLHLSDVFGKCACFFIHEQDKNTNEVIPNPFAHELGGAGIQTARMLIEKNVDVVITKRIGSNPLRFLKLANVKVYQCNEKDVLKAIQLFEERELAEYENSNGDFPAANNGKRCRRMLDNKNKKNKKGSL